MDVCLENKLENNDETSIEEKKPPLITINNNNNNNNKNQNNNNYKIETKNGHNNPNHHNHNYHIHNQAHQSQSSNSSVSVIEVNNQSPIPPKQNKIPNIEALNANNYQQNKKPLTHQQNVEYWKTLKKAVIQGNKVDLVPYTKDHVATYNAWLKDPYIQSMTNSEPYSMEQEFEYQKEWEEDDEKYIFIILDISNKRTMAGDINLFIRDDQCELNVMIAEEKSRRKGLAFETLKLIIEWAQQQLDICKFYAKIQCDNKGSIALFQKLQFIRTDYADAFKEFTYTLDLGNTSDN